MFDARWRGPTRNTSAIRTDAIEQRALTDSYSLTLDTQRGIIRHRNIGFWTADEVCAFFPVFRALASECRQRFGRILMLCDLIDAPAQDKSTAATLAGLGSIFGPGDKLAVAVNTAVAKIQMRRVGSADGMMYFDSDEAAVAWLVAPLSIGA